MKRILFTGLAAILFWGCAKEKADGDCRLIHYTTYSGSGQVGEMVSFSYNNEGKILSIQNKANGITNSLSYSYFTDSVVAVNEYQRTTYYLNNRGLADSSHVIFIPANPNGLSFRDFYTYDAEGFVTSHRNIFSQVYNGSVIRDTTSQTYTITDGNMTSMVDAGIETRYFYTDKQRQNNRILPPFLEYEQLFPFLGKHSRNLPDHTETSTGGLLSSFEYQINGNGNVTRFTQNYGGGAKSFFEFNYDCND